MRYNLFYIIWIEVRIIAILNSFIISWKCSLVCCICIDVGLLLWLFICCKLFFFGLFAICWIYIFQVRY